MSAQDEVVKAVGARGYREGYTDDQFAARQVAKLCEELYELSVSIRQFGNGVPSNWELCLEEAGYMAQQDFDDDKAWDLAEILFPVAAASELADMQVVLFCLADVLDEDVVELAREKAARDVERGVR